METLTKQDIDLIMTSLDYAKRKFQETAYPSYEMKQERLGYVDSVRRKLRSIKKEIGK